MSAYNVQWATRFGGATRSHIVGCNGTPGTEGNVARFMANKTIDPQLLQIQRKGDHLATTRGLGACLSKIDVALALQRARGATIMMSTAATIDEVDQDHLGFVMTQAQIQLVVAGRGEWQPIEPIVIGFEKESQVRQGAAREPEWRSWRKVTASSEAAYAEGRHRGSKGI